MMRIRLSALVVALCCLPSIALASPILETRAGWNAFDEDHKKIGEYTAYGTSHTAFTGAYDGDPSSVAVSEAFASYGEIAIYGKATRSADSTEWYTFGSYAYASWQDDWSILSSDVSLDGTSGTAILRFDLEGVLIPSRPGLGGYPAIWVGVNGTSKLYSNNVPPGTYATPAFDFVWGKPFTLKTWIAGGGYIPGTEAGEIIVDFSHSFTLAGVAIADSSGQAVTDFHIDGASGTSYLVPEPATLLLLGSGLVGLARSRRRRG